MSQASETEQIKQLQRREEDKITHGCFRVAHHCNVIVITAFQHSVDLAPGPSVSTERVSSGQNAPGTFHLSELRSLSQFVLLQHNADIDSHLCHSSTCGHVASGFIISNS